MFKNTNHLGRWLVIAVAIGLMCCSTSLAKKPPKPAGTTYRIVPLEYPASAWDINDYREVVGATKFEPGVTLAAYWTFDGVQLSDPTPLLGGRWATGINNNGEIVGESIDSVGPDTNDIAVYWRPNYMAEAMDLPMPEGYDNSVATSINDDGLICGLVSKNHLDDDGNRKPGSSDYTSRRAVVWQVDYTNGTIDGPYELPSGDGSSSRAMALNNSALNDNGDEVAQVVGDQSSVVPGESGAFVWEVTSHLDGTFEISVSRLGDGSPLGINNFGFICGTKLNRHRDYEGVVWHGDTESYLDRGRGRDQVWAQANDISDSGIIVGQAGVGSNFWIEERACFWDGIDGSLVYLDQFLEEDSPLSSLMSANAVNLEGDILGRTWIAVQTND